MRTEAFFLLGLVGCALSGPARRDCGQEKCHHVVNDCGITYGGCWTECGNGPTEMATFTAPLCDSRTDAGYATHSPDTVTDDPSSTGSPAESLITPPPTLDTSLTPRPDKTKSCTALWLCVDYLAVCGDSSQMYGGCYDVCTSAPPVTSPPCSLSSSTTEFGYAIPSSLSSSSAELGYAVPSSFSRSTIESGYAIPTASPEPGAAYTKDSASDNVAPAIDDNKALVMAEMPSPDSSALKPSATLAVEFRLANANAEEPNASPATEASTLVEAPANLRGAAIAKMMADKNRKPKTDNVPCWDKDTCKEVQLGIPSPAPSQPSAESSAAPTAVPSSSTTAEPSFSASADAAAEAPTGTPAEAPADIPADAPAESSTVASP